MKETGTKVKLLKPFDVDLITIRKDRYFTNAYLIDLPLDSIPDHVWQDIFERTWKSSRRLWDRKLFVVGEKLRLATTANEFPDKLDWVEEVINKTNKEIDKYNRLAQLEEDRKTEEIKRISQEEKAKVDMMRDTLRKRFVPI